MHTHARKNTRKNTCMYYFINVRCLVGICIDAAAAHLASLPLPVVAVFLLERLQALSINNIAADRAHVPAVSMYVYMFAHI